MRITHNKAASSTVCVTDEIQIRYVGNDGASHDHNGVGMESPRTLPVKTSLSLSTKVTWKDLEAYQSSDAF